ncbi:hypothetical protein [Thermus caldilimi]|uniref:hypothetical protein n=1 Tax=Thermus caldilimi TaxID=2483360 RepID=UPI0010761B56|nr:hypothetical protein [Thermus caldilimi]
MPFLVYPLIGLLTIYTLALGLGQPEVWKEAWPWALAYYGTTLAGDLWTTLRGLERGYRESNLLYAKALQFGSWGMPLVDLGLLSLKVVFLTRLTGDPLLSYPLALAIAGHGHLVGFLWNLGQLTRAQP